MRDRISLITSQIVTAPKPALSAKEQQGIFTKIRNAFDSHLPSTKKANAGKHAIKAYQPCKSKNDALMFAKNELGFETVSKSLTLPELNKINGAFYELMQRNPFMKGFVKTVKAGKMNACAHFAVERKSGTAGRFLLGTEFKFDRSSLASAANDCNMLCKNDKNGIAFWSLKHDASGIVAHEFAHAVEYYVTMRRLGISPGDEISALQVVQFHNARGSVSKEIIEEAFKRSGIEYNETNVMKHISKYAKENSREALAEALSCEDEGNIVCNTVKEVTNEHLRKEGLL